jgi:hypothetical protein
MFMKILAASVLTIGLATSAMAQGAGTNGAGTDGSGSGKSVTVNPVTPASPNTTVPDEVDPNATNSTTGGMNSNADQNCPTGPQGNQADASGTSPGTAAPTVNDSNCGK